MTWLHGRADSRCDCTTPSCHPPTGHHCSLLRPSLCAGNQASGVLLGVQVPPQDEEEFQAAGALGVLWLGPARCAGERHTGSA